MKRNLKIGFLFGESNEVPAWYFETIHNTITQTSHSIYFIRGNFGAKLKEPFFYRLFCQFENYWFRPDADATKEISLRSMIDQTKTINLSFSEGLILHENELDKLKSYGLDLIYTDAFRQGMKENVSAAANFGLWYIVFGCGSYKQKSPPAFWEVMNNDAVTGSSLVARKNENEWLIYEGTTRTVPYSVKNNFNSIAWKSSSYAGLRINELSCSGDDFFSRFKKIIRNDHVKHGLPNAEMPFLFLKNGLAYLGYKIKEKLKRKNFTVLYSFKNFSFDNLLRADFIFLNLPPETFYADPFIVEKDGRYYIFLETYNYSVNKAHISVIEVDEQKKLSSPRSVLDLSYHLSYPFVFFHGGDYYMIPETASNKTVELYKARNFPDKWEFVMSLMEGKELIDVTLHFENGKWWLFANNASHPCVSTNDQLFLFYNDDLFSNNWVSHPHNPIATHIDNCRPAGRIFRHNGKLYRPAQNNASQQYGYGLKINEIITMNEKEYIEKEILSIVPEQLGLKACHHLDFCNGLVVIDGVK